MNKSEAINIIDECVSEIVDFIKTFLYPRKDVNHQILDRYISVFSKYQKSKNTDDLTKFRDVYYRPSIEGADTDFTEGISLNVGDNYKSLMSLFDELEKLIMQNSSAED